MFDQFCLLGAVEGEGSLGTMASMITKNNYCAGQEKLEQSASRLEESDMDARLIGKTETYFDHDNGLAIN